MKTKEEAIRFARRRFRYNKMSVDNGQWKAVYLDDLEAVISEVWQAAARETVREIFNDIDKVANTQTLIPCVDYDKIKGLEVKYGLTDTQEEKPAEEI